MRRILELKIRHGLLSGADTERRIEAAEKTVDSAAHHEIEADIAAKAVIILKNHQALPLSGNGKRIVIVCRTSNDRFRNFFRDRLDKMVSNLQAKGFASTPYEDMDW